MEADTDTDRDELQSRLAELMEAAPRRPEPPLSNDELRWLRRFKKDRDHHSWLRKQIFVLAPIITSVVVTAIAAWKWLLPFLAFPA